eukprot:jgi/Ulvmu1/11313/UM074_0028.1
MSGTVIHCSMPWRIGLQNPSWALVQPNWAQSLEAVPPCGAYLCNVFCESLEAATSRYLANATLELSYTPSIRTTLHDEQPCTVVDFVHACVPLPHLALRFPSSNPTIEKMIVHNVNIAKTGCPTWQVLKSGAVKRTLVSQF